MMIALILSGALIVFTVVMLVGSRGMSRADAEECGRDWWLINVDPGGLREMIEAYAERYDDGWLVQLQAYDKRRAVCVARDGTIEAL